MSGVREQVDQWSVQVWEWVRASQIRMVALAVIPMCVFVLLAISPWYVLHLRDSASWPYHVLFLVKKGAVPERGDLVAFNFRHSYMEKIEPVGRARPQIQTDHIWLKRVMGMPGDVVTTKGEEVFINGQPVAEGMKQDRFGVPLEVTKTIGQIPSGFYFVTLPHPRSFDSRYYGPIEQADVVGVAIPLL